MRNVKLTLRRKVSVLAGDVRPGERVWLDGRAREVWRIRPTGAEAVTLDLHGVYLRLREDQVVQLDRAETTAPIVA
jgi:hypothetical protein